MTVGELSHRHADAGNGPRTGHVIVLAYMGSGAEHLQAALSAFPQLTCTSGTRIVPLCHHAVTAWQEVDARADGGLSPLAAASVRALSAGLVTAILARGGGTRWCELTTAPPIAAETVARLYPQTRFLTAHRRSETFIRAVLDASPWGLAGTEFAPFLSAHPASTIAALASYWAIHTAALLEFEQAHPQSCLRVRTEDLHANPQQAQLDISYFLGTDRQPALRVDQGPGNTRPPGDQNLPAAPPGIPLAQIPPPLLAQLSDLHCRLAYSPPTTAGQ